MQKISYVKAQESEGKIRLLTVHSFAIFVKTPTNVPI